MTVLIYVDTSKNVGDPDHLKVFANENAAETWLQEMTLKAWCSNMRSWSEFCSATTCIPASRTDR
jgi:hypothetical protein